ncbi:alpha-amylase family glycosyl hydrolase [candidate division KSB1 bacterium]
MKYLKSGILLIVLFIFSYCRYSGKEISLWRNGVTYEILVLSFADSDGDGKGDINGLTQKLDYIKNLGAEAVWLLPLSPSPSYHKYDVTDYYDIHPDYGSLDDFKKFIHEAHENDIKVIIDLVINHTSSLHPWFLEAKSDRNSPYRDYYVWAKDEEIETQFSREEKGAFGQNVWYRNQGDDQKYYAYFYYGMPDLNFDNPAVRNEAFKIGRYWLEEIGVDGFRLDAAKHIFPDDRSEDNQKWWVEFRKEMRKIRKDVYLVGEVMDNTEIITPYFEGLDALFNFPAASDILDAVKNENSGKLVDNLIKTRNVYGAVSEDFLDAVFLTNHDQNRVMSVFEGNIGHAKIAASILMTLPGAPYIYYGEELGMFGRKPDEYIREPFIWSEDVNEFQTNWIEARYSTESTVISAEKQLLDENSLLSHYRSLISLRKRSNTLLHGEIGRNGIKSSNILSYFRTLGNDSLLVMHNLSEETVEVEMQVDLSGFLHQFYSINGTVKKSGSSVNLSPYSTAIYSNKSK